MLKIAFDKDYIYELEKGHRFPMIKYELIPEQLVREGTCSHDNFFSPKMLSVDHALKTHDEHYYNRLCNLNLTKKEERPIGFPMSMELVNREKKIARGTVDCCNFSLKYGVSMNIAGGTHHAFYDRGEAFCMLNDQAIAARYLLDHGHAQKILIIDLDVHQGNGTAEIFQQEDRVFTFSMHGKKNYPFKKEISDWDIGLEDHTDDEQYLNILSETLPRLFEKVNPDFVFYLSGVDVVATDRLGRLGMSVDGCKQRDQMVLQYCHQRSLGVQCSMGGGYSSDIKIIIDAHANTYRSAQRIY